MNETDIDRMLFEVIGLLFCLYNSWLDRALNSFRIPTVIIRFDPMRPLRTNAGGRHFECTCAYAWVSASTDTPPGVSGSQPVRNCFFVTGA